MEESKDTPNICREDIGGDGADLEHIPAEEKEARALEEAREERKREKPLKIHGSLNDVLRAAMRPKKKD